jgi:cytochrome P450
MVESPMSEIAELPLPRGHALHPPPKYRELSMERPVVKVRTPRGDHAWLITRFEDVRAVLVDPRFSSDPRTPGFPSYLTGGLEPPPGFFMQFDNPDHSRLRGSVSREFIARRMEDMRPRMREILDELIEAMTAGPREAELIERLALPMSARVICEFLGVSPGDTKTVKAHVDVLLDRARPPEEVIRAATELSAYFEQLVTDKEQRPGEDLLSMLVKGSPGNGVQRPELVGIATLLLLGGYDTMVQMIGLGVLTLLEHPQQLAELVADESLMPNAVDELLRYLTVNHAGLPRAALADVEIGGQLIHAREGVLVMINAANRDPAVFPDPDAFDIRRKASRHVAFGYGLHKCIGLALARVELETVFHGLFKRLPGLRLTAPIQSLSFRHDMVLYGVNELPVAW